ncbi:MAG TPA: hypothetical protein VN634_01635 [Candidatus Limnocylindrales bacterium]|nr:hypothetical protein [Candidatus Limnocylindrales bacterium]
MGEDVSRPVAWRAGIAGAAIAAAVLLAAVATASTNLNDASSDKIEASTIVPDPVRRVGEVRLLARGDAVVVQTLLSTKVLSRVLAEIAKKEEHNWPTAQKLADSDAAPVASGTTEYLAALDAARQRLEASASDSDSPERRRRVLIEFAASANDQAVFVGTFQAAGDVGHLDLKSREIFSTLALPRAYILREIRLILADSFDVAEDQVDRLGPLGPAASGAATGSSASTSPATIAPAPSNNAKPATSTGSEPATPAVKEHAPDSMGSPPTPKPRQH